MDAGDSRNKRKVQYDDCQLGRNRISMEQTRRIHFYPERYTYEFIENGDYFTLSFLGQEHKDVHKICGSKSGRDIDKIKATGIQPYFSESGNILFKEARISIECKKLYTDMIKEENFLDKSLFEKWYGGAHGNPHKVYVAEIVNMWVNE